MGILALYHFEEGNGATTCVDSSGAGNALTCHINVAESTTTAKAGAGSIYSGASASTTSYAASANNIGPSTGDFTIEWFQNIPNTVGGDLIGLAGANPCFIYASVASGYPVLRVLVNGGYNLTAATACTAGTWQHCAITRVGSSYYLCLDGVIVSVYAGTTVSIGGGAFGVFRGDVIGNGLPGSYIDEVRYTDGVGLYSGILGATYSVPSVPLSGGLVPYALSGKLPVSYSAGGLLAGPKAILGKLPVAYTFSGVSNGPYKLTDAIGISYTFSGVLTGPKAITGSLQLAATIKSTTSKWPAVINGSLPLSYGVYATKAFGSFIYARLTAGLPPITGSIYAGVTTAYTGVLNGFLPQISGTISATVGGITSIIIGNLPPITVTWGSLIGILPPLTANYTTQNAFNGQVTYAMNIKTGETTQYLNYNFLSILRIGTSYYGVRSDGVYLLGGSLDITAPIPAGFTTAESTLGSTSIKHVPFLYMDAQNPCTVMQITDGETAGPFHSHPTGLKTKLARGIRGKVWQFKISNINGNAFRIGALEALSESTSHRVK